MELVINKVLENFMKSRSLGRVVDDWPADLKHHFYQILEEIIATTLIQQAQTAIFLIAFLFKTACKNQSLHGKFTPGPS
jgi:hypothetical protein